MAAIVGMRNPAAKIGQFNAALTNFATVMGTAGMSDAMAVLDKVTAGLNRLFDFGRDHPKMAEVLFDTAGRCGRL